MVILLGLILLLHFRAKNKIKNAGRPLDEADALHDALHRQQDDAVHVDGNVYRFGATCGRGAFVRTLRHDGQWKDPRAARRPALRRGHARTATSACGCEPS